MTFSEKWNEFPGLGVIWAVFLLVTIAAVTGWQAGHNSGYSLGRRDGSLIERNKWVRGTMRVNPTTQEVEEWHPPEYPGDGPLWLAQEGGK
jgi:hypothetical protein